MIRSATLNDLSELGRIENLSFETDRFSRRSFRYLLTKANAKTLVDEQEGQIRGYVMLLFNVGTSWHACTPMPSTRLHAVRASVRPW